MKVKEKSINVIFAVTKQQISVYNKLSEHIEGSYSAELSEDSSNVVDMVQEQYNKISSSVEMKDNASGNIKIKYYSTCLGTTRMETNKCDELKVGDVVSFETEIVVTSCPQDPSEWFQTFRIYPVGINESLTIDLEMLCSCPCEQSGHPAYEEHSEICNNAGTLKCGICECDDTHFGRNCECATNDVLDNKNLYMGCRDNNSLIDCNGQGDCSCGQCQCYARPKPEEVISGKYCECDNFSCDRHNGLLCSGPDHGTCVCKECVCQPGWTGSACECRESNDTCIAPNSSGDVLCSGHGDCECGACRCHITEEGRYSGHYCERCPTCAGRCQDLKECVQCQVYKNGPLKDEKDCSTNCSHIHIIHVTTLEHDEKKDEHLCTFYDEDECRFQFVYTEDKDNKVIIRAQEDRECPPKVFMLGIVLGVIAAIVLIGMAMLLIWKAVTTISDRREFARFEKERMMAKWDTGENPIYKQATSTFKNPTYAGK
jgi:protocadherin alpha